MRCWRIGYARYRRAGNPARFPSPGARWNPPGVPALYCAGSIALCTLEKFVHLGDVVLPKLVLLKVEIPDDVPLLKPSRADIPPDWQTFPYAESTQEFGRSFLMDSRELAMEVPSVLVPEEPNWVINPAHPRFRDVRLTEVRSFRFDPRMFAVSKDAG